MPDVLIVEDHPVVVEGLQKLLKDSNIASTCIAAYTVEECLRILKSFSPNLVLLDYHLPDGNGIDLCKTILKQYPATKVLAISSFKEQSLMRAMIEAGAMGYVLKNASEEEILEAIGVVMNGEKYMCGETQELLDEKNATRTIITPRELEVLKFIAEGLTNTEIAEKLFISPLTVDSHRKNLILKLNAKNTASLIKLAVLKGYVI